MCKLKGRTAVGVGVTPDWVRGPWIVFSFVAVSTRFLYGALW